MKLIGYVLIIVLGTNLITSCGESKKQESQLADNKQSEAQATEAPKESKNNEAVADTLNIDPKRKRELIEFAHSLNTKEVKDNIIAFYDKYIEWSKSADYLKKMKSLLSKSDTLSYEKAFQLKQKFIQTEMQKDLIAIGYETLADIQKAAYIVASIDSSFAKSMDSLNIVMKKIDRENLKKSNL